MNKIKQEEKESLKYNFEEIVKGELVALTKSNVALVEAMIRHDSDYSDSGRVDKESSAHWFVELKKNPKRYEEIIPKCVESVDKKNSTHLNADGVGRGELSQRIIDYGWKSLQNFLKDTKQEKYSLINILSEKTQPKDLIKYKARHNFSFATKFCHYACYWIYEGKEEQDNFSIYDSVVSENLKKYAQYYGVAVPRKNTKDYASYYAAYIDTLDAIIKKSGNAISRNGFDHLLWYYHKAK